MPEEPLHFLSVRIHSIDDLVAVARGWSVDFRQLDGGGLKGEFSQVADGQSLITHNRYGRRIEQRGEAPAGMLTFGVLEPGVSVRWHGREVDSQSLLVFRELDAASRPGFNAHTFSFSEERLAEVVRLTGVTEAEEFFDGAIRAVRTDPGSLRELRRRLSRLHDDRSAEPEPAREAARRYDLRFGIPAALLRALASSRGEVRRPPSRVRDLARKRALAFIEAHPNEQFKVRDVCRAVRVSERTLEYAFLEHFGVTPKTYLRAVSLTAARRELREAAPGTKITDVANQLGFWHMGQFAADYRKQFGELPSETLRERLVLASESPGE
jgi:AraC family ethanolamine operon transcriptional activator